MNQKTLLYEDKVLFISSREYSNLELLKLALPKEEKFYNEYSELEQQAIEDYNNYISKLTQNRNVYKSIKIDGVLEKFKIKK